MTPSTSQTRDRTRRTLGAGVAVMVIAALCVSVVEGTPRPLPGLALGSLVLLHAERTLALVGVVIAALSVLAQGRSRPPPG